MNFQMDIEASSFDEISVATWLLTFERSLTGVLALMNLQSPSSRVFFVAAKELTRK